MHGAHSSSDKPAAEPSVAGVRAAVLPGWDATAPRCTDPARAARALSASGNATAGRVPSSGPNLLVVQLKGRDLVALLPWPWAVRGGLGSASHHCWLALGGGGDRTRG